MSSSAVDWAEIKTLIESLTHSAVGPGAGWDAEWRLIETAFARLLQDSDFSGLITLRDELNPLYARDTITGLKFLQQLDQEAIAAARQFDQKETLAHLLGAKGHNLHRQGYHQQSITAFSESASLYQQLNNPWEATKNHYMTALCHRALGNRDEALQILDDVMGKVDQHDPWYGQPLQVKAWLIQDKGDLPLSENLLRRAIYLQKQGNNSDILVAGTLTDLAEVVGLQNRFSEANGIFFQSLAILNRSRGQYNRQIARTKLKMAELSMRQKEFIKSLSLLEEADKLISGFGHYYDLMWRIELLRAIVFLRLGHFKTAFLKFRATQRFRNELKLSFLNLAKQLISRLYAGNGLPR